MKRSLESRRDKRDQITTTRTGKSDLPDFLVDKSNNDVNAQRSTLEPNAQVPALFLS